VSEISWYIAIGLAFVVGLLLFGIGSSMLRSAKDQAARPPKPASPQWPTLIDETLNDADKMLRLDMIERLSIVRSEWSRDILARARAQERDPDVLSAIDIALHA
jgi:hypothetical protein